MIETKVYLSAHLGRSRSPNIEHESGAGQTYHGTHYLLQEQEYLLHRRQGAQVDSGKASDSHGRDAVEEAVDVRYLVCCRDAVEDARENEGKLYDVSSSIPAVQRAWVTLEVRFSSSCIVLASLLQQRQIEFTHKDKDQHV